MPRPRRTPPRRMLPPAGKADVKNRAHPYIQRILTPLKAGQNLPSLRQLKNESPALVSYILGWINAHNSLSKKVVGLEFPESLRDFLATIPISDAEDLSQELRWTSQVLSNYVDRINDFLGRSANFETALVSGHISAARSAYNEIIVNFGHSLWAIEAGVLLAQHEGGISANRNFTADVSENTDDSVAEIFSQLVSARVEAHLSPSAYRDEATSLLEGKPFGYATHLTAAYVLFRTHILSFHRYTHLQLSYILNMESTFSVIDRYNTFVLAMQLLVCSENSSSAFDLISEPLAILVDRIRDSRLYALRQRLWPATRPADSELRQALLVCNDAYLQGDYEHASQLSAEGIRLFPTSFEFYDIHCRSQIHRKQGPCVNILEASIQHAILQQTYFTLERGQHTSAALRDLEKAAYAFSYSRFGHQLFSFVARHSSARTSIDVRLFGALSEVAQLPQFMMFFPNLETRKDFLKAVANDHDTSAHRLYTSLLDCTGIEGIEALPPTIPAIQRHLYLGMWLHELGDYVAAGRHFEQSERLAPEDPVFHTLSLAGRFSCLLRSCDFAGAAVLAVNAYFNHNNSITAIQINDLIAECDSLAPRSLAALEWPVLYSLYYAEWNMPRNDKRLFALCETFLASCGVQRPSAIEPQWGNYDTRTLCYFLRNVCVPEVIDSSIEYSSTQDVENERISILEILARVDGGTKEDELEIARLKRAHALREALQAVDHSKVYVDEAGIRRSFDRSFAEEFERYKEYRGLDLKLRQSLVELGRLIAGRKTKKSVEIVYVDESYQLFHMLFLSIRDKYISSNEYGLDSYLSMRIRHGTFAGQMRRSFEECYLVTTTTGLDGRYSPNEYWRSRWSSLGSSRLAELDGRLAQFSKSVDAAIDIVKDDLLQIRGTTKPAGLFDFDYSEAAVRDLSERFSSVSTFDEFVDGIFSELRSRTDGHLRAVQKSLREQLAQQLISSLNQLEIDVLSIASNVATVELTNMIVQCQTSLQHDIETIAAWFQSLGSHHGADARLSALVNAVIEDLRLSAAIGFRELQPECRRDFVCPGSMVVHLFDAIRILISNSMKYTSLDPNQISVQIGDVRNTCAIFIRNIPKDSHTLASLGALALELENRANNRVSPIHVKREGNSGYYKLGRILQVNLPTLTPTVSVRAHDEDATLFFDVTLIVDVEETD